MSSYELAQQSDPEYQAAIAAHQAALEVAPQSRAALLPSIGLSGLASRDRYDPRNSGDTSYATNQTYSVGLRQAIYQRASLLQLEQADSSIAQADAQLAAAQQDLLLRVTTRYFLVLGALDNLEFVQADKAASGAPWSRHRNASRSDWRRSPTLWRHRHATISPSATRSTPNNCWMMRGKPCAR